MSQAQTTAPPITSAVVIGIGGSGVHTLGRLRKAVRDTNRPGRTSLDNVKFLAIDAVDQTGQLPALPPGAELGVAEFLNIASKPINAYEYVAKAWQHDSSLRATWDLTYTAPNQPLTDGMKRSRALGNLVFRTQAVELQAAIQRTLDAAVALNPVFYGEGKAGARNRIKVYIVTSCAGGTGSSGFAHVLHAVHRAGRVAGVNVAVYPVIYLPDIFMGARAGSLRPQMEERAHWSNAYAFLSELDYVISESGAFDELLCPKDMMPTGVEPLDVIESAYLIDSRFTDGSTMTQTDAYDMAASGLYALLLTAASSLLGVAGTNVDVKGFDALQPPQRTAYATLGSFRTVFPGSTYRRFAASRLRSYLVKGLLLDDEKATNEVDLARPVIQDIITRIDSLSAGFAVRAGEEPKVRMLNARVGDIELQLSEAKGVEEAIAGHYGSVIGNAQAAAAELTRVFPGEVSAAAAMISSRIDEALQNSGEGLKVLLYAVKTAQQHYLSESGKVERFHQGARQRLSDAQQPGREGSLGERVEKVQLAANKNFLVRQGELKEAVKGYANAARQFVKDVVETNISQAQIDLLKDVNRELADIRTALESAAQLMGELVSRSEDIWQLDDFEGKDAGAYSLTALVPSDVLPEVEASSVARAIWARIELDLGTNPRLQRSRDSNGRAWVRDVYTTWWKQGKSNRLRGLVSFGQGDINAVAQEQARDILVRILDKEIEEIGAVERIFPADLYAAADMADAVERGDVLALESEDEGPGPERRRLDNALQETLRRASNVALQIDPARVVLQAGESLPLPLINVSASGEGMRWAESIGGFKTIDSQDPEQLVTLTLQIGFPIGAVRGLDVWHDAFRKVTRDRAHFLGQSMDPPPFLDRRIADRVSTRPLVRRLYSEAQIAALVVQGTVLLRMLRHEPTASAMLGLRSPLDTKWKAGRGSEVVVLGMTFAIRDGKVVENGVRVVTLGSSAAQVFDKLAQEASVQKSIEDVWDWLINRAKSSAEDQETDLLNIIAGQLEKYRQQNEDLSSALPRENPSPEVVRESQVRQAIAEAIYRQREELLQPLGSDIAPDIW